MNRSILGGTNVLTDDFINILQGYFDKAIRENVGKDVDTMSIKDIIFVLKLKVPGASASEL